MLKQLELVELSEADIDQIMVLERKVCIPLIQASENTIRVRFKLGNTMLGVRHKGILVGSIGFRYGEFSPDNPCDFTKEFREFSTPTKRPDKYNSGFCYSVNVDPELRMLAVEKKQRIHISGLGVAKLLLSGMKERITEKGCSWAVGDGRPAFYNGSLSYPHERYDGIPELAEILDRCTKENRSPSEEEKEQLLRYPIFRAYDKLLGGGVKIAWILPNFFPEDTPTGGFRVILYKHLHSSKDAPLCI